MNAGSAFGIGNTMYIAGITTDAVILVEVIVLRRLQSQRLIVILEI